MSSKPLQKFTKREPFRLKEVGSQEEMLFADI